MHLTELPPTVFPDLLACLGRRGIQRALADGELVQLGSSVLVGSARRLRSVGAEAHAIDVRAALLRMEGLAVASHGSGALLHDLWRLGRHSGRVRLTRGGGRYRRLDIDARLHVAGLPPEHLTCAYDVPVTTQARTAMDLARSVSFRGGVVVTDSALRAGCTRAELDAVTSFCTRWPGVRRARAVAAFARGESESPLESVSRAWMQEVGLPEPEIQVWLGDGLEVVGRVDFFWREAKLVGEADGLAKYTIPDVLRAEKLRQELLEQAGFRVVRWTWDDIWRRSTSTADRLFRALGSAP